MTAWEINKSCVNIWMEGSMAMLGMGGDGQGMDVVGDSCVFWICWYSDRFIGTRMEYATA